MMLGSGGGKLQRNESFREAIEPWRTFDGLSNCNEAILSRRWRRPGGPYLRKRSHLFTRWQRRENVAARGWGQNACKIPCRLPPRRPPSHFSSCFVHRESVCQRPIKNGPRPRSERRTTEVGRRSVVEGNCRLVTCSNLVRQFVAVITPPTPPSWNTLCSAAPLDDSPRALFVSPPTYLDYGRYHHRFVDVHYALQQQSRQSPKPRSPTPNGKHCDGKLGIYGTVSLNLPLNNCVHTGSSVTAVGCRPLPFAPRCIGDKKTDGLRRWGN